MRLFSLHRRSMHICSSIVPSLPVISDSTSLPRPLVTSSSSLTPPISSLLLSLFSFFPGHSRNHLGTRASYFFHLVLQPRSRLLPQFPVRGTSSFSLHSPRLLRSSSSHLLRRFFRLRQDTNVAFVFADESEAGEMYKKVQGRGKYCKFEL